MRFAVGLGKGSVEERLDAYGLNRREFLKYCSAVAVAMGMASSFGVQVAKALTSGRRPSVVYLHNAECTGCSEALLRTSDPFLDVILFDVISLDYQETLMAAAGKQAEEVLHEAINSPEGFICMVEGAIPTAQAGIFGKIADRSLLEINTEVLKHKNCMAIIASGTCASFGGVQAASPNPTGAQGVLKTFPELIAKTINISGCPPNPINIVGTIVYYLQNKGALPPMDDKNRPDMFYGLSVHEQCERLPHFQAGEFADSFDSDEARMGWCLYHLGCKGPMTYNNCPKVKFNGTNWPVAAGHPCIGCSEPDFWDHMSPFYSD